MAESGFPSIALVNPSSLPHALPQANLVPQCGWGVSHCPSRQEASGQPKHSDTWSHVGREYLKPELSFRDCNMWFPEAQGH